MSAERCYRADMRRWWLGAGGNLGDVRATLTRATEALRAYARDVQLSPLYTSTPVGANAGERFVNAAIGLSTDLAPLDLLDACQALENECGRTRSVHWGPRTLDLDLLLTDDGLLVEHPRLTLPHPHFWYRRFVLEPLAEIAPDVREPHLQRTVRAWSERWRIDPLVIQVIRPVPSGSTLLTELHARFPRVQIIDADVPDADAGMVIEFASDTQPRFAPGRIVLPTDPVSAERWLNDILTAVTDPVHCL